MHNLEIIEGEQGTDEWKAHKLGRPSSSSFDKVITPAKGALSAQRHAYGAQIIVEKVLGIPADELDGYQSPWMEHGNLVEEEARDAYAFLKSADVRQVSCGILDGDIVASPDGLIDKHGGLELKCPKPTTHVKYLLDGGLPNEYKCQVHGNMFVFDRQWWDFMSYAPDFPPFIIRVHRDDFTDTLGAAVREFVMETKANYQIILDQLQGAN